MRALLLLGLAAMALATSHRIPNPRWLEELVTDRQVQDTQFQPQREYKFVYNGQLLTGIPHSSKQHSATRIQAVCTVVFKTQNQCLLQCKHIRIGKLNSKVPEPRRMVPFFAFEEVPIEQELKQQLQAPVKFQYQNGLINDIVFDGREQPWSANIKRSVLNMLQVNLGQQGRTDRNQEAVLRNEVTEPEDPENDYFSALEKTLEGECECDYTVTSQPSRYSKQPVLNITKSVNFEKCRRRPDIRYNYRFSTPCPTCDNHYEDQEKMLRSSTVTKYHITGTTQQYLINKVISESQYSYVPMTEQANVITSYVNQTLVLVSSGPIQGDVEEPKNPKPSDSQMLFTPEWDVLKEKFFQEGEELFHDKTPYSEIEDKKEFVGQILNRLVRCVSESVEQCAPRQFVRLVKVLRMCKMEELKQIHNSYYKSTPSSFTPEDHKKIKDLLVDALAIAGTKDCVTHLVEKIKRREIQPIKAAMSIKNLINVRVPSQQMIEQLVQLAQHEVCQRNHFLKQSVLLTTGSMINALCGEHKDKLAVEIQLVGSRCPRALKQQYTETLFELFKNAKTIPKKVLALKTLSNAGLDLSVFKLEKIIKNTGARAPYNSLVRSEAILALRRLRGTMPRKIQKILMPIFMNEQEIPDVRIVSIYQIMQTLPERPVLDQITRQLFKERSRQVASFVISQLRSLANSTNPCEKRVAEDLKLSLRRAKQQHLYERGSSKLIQLRGYSRKFDSDLSLDLGVVMTNTSYLPRYLAATINTNTHSQWLKHLFSVGISQKGAEKWIRQLYSQRGYFEQEFDQVLRRSPRSTKTMSPKNLLKKLYQKLQITDRYQSEQNPIVMPYMKFKDQDIGFLPISPESIPESISQMIQADRLDIQQIESTLEQGIQLDFYQAFMLHEQSRKIPTTLGLPLRTTVKLPIIMRIAGHISGQMEPKNKLRMLKLSVNLKPSMALGMSAKMECWSPVVNSGLKVIGQLNVYVPMKFEAKVDARKDPIDTQLVYEPQRNQYQLLKAQTRPITYTYVWPKSMKQWEEPEERTVYGEEWNRIRRYKSEFGQNAMGIKVQTEVQWHRTPQRNVPGTPLSPFSGPNKLRITVQPGEGMPKEVVIKVTGKLFQQVKKTMTPEFENFFDSQDESYFKQDYQGQYEPESVYSEFEGGEPVNNQMFVKIFTRGGPKRTCEIKANCKMTERQRHYRCQLNIKRTPVPQVESGQWALNAETEVFYPETPSKFSELTEDKKFLSQLKATWGSSQKKNVEIKIQGQQSRQQIQQRREEQHRYRSECSSPVCQYEQLKRASLLTDYRIDIDYTLGKKEQNISNALYRLFKHYYYWQTDVDQIQVQNQQNQVRAHITIDPRSHQYVNITIQTPHETSKVKDIPLCMKLQPVNMHGRSSRARTFWEYTQRMVEPTMAQCEVRTRTVKTFDGQRVRLPFSQCYSVLAKDCSQPENPEFAVMIKKVDQHGSKKQVKILSEHRSIVLLKEQGQIHVEIDGEKEPCPEFKEIKQHQHVVLRIQRSGPQTCKVSLPEAGVKVYFDGYAANIKMSQLYQNQQCGLCGHYNGEMYDDFMNPQYQQVSLPEFHRSYLLREQCEVEDELNDDTKYSIYSEDEQQEYEPDWHNSQKGSCPSIRKVIEQTESTCQDHCQYDNSEKQCPPNKVCCYNGCGHVCVEPRQTPYPQNGRRYRQPIRRIKMIEQGEEVCFSKEPVPVCPSGTYPSEYEETQKVIYSCVKQQQGDQYQTQLLRNEIVEELESLPATFHNNESIPKLCVRY